MALGRLPARVLQTQWLLCATVGILQTVLGIDASHSARPVEGIEARPPGFWGTKSQRGSPGRGLGYCLRGIFLSLRNKTPKSVQFLCSSFLLVFPRAVSPFLSSVFQKAWE